MAGFRLRENADAAGVCSAGKPDMVLKMMVLKMMILLSLHRQPG
jgi:hypothetical protein